MGEFIIFTVLGGIGRLLGSVAGVCLFVVPDHMLNGVSEFWLIHGGAILLLGVLFARGGLIGSLAGRAGDYDGRSFAIESFIQVVRGLDGHG